MTDETQTFTAAVAVVRAGAAPETHAKELYDQLSDDESLGLLDGDLPFWEGMSVMVDIGSYCNIPYAYGQGTDSASRASTSSTAPVAASAAMAPHFRCRWPEAPPGMCSWRNGLVRRSGSAAQGGSGDAAPQPGGTELVGGLELGGVPIATTVSSLTVISHKKYQRGHEEVVG